MAGQRTPRAVGWEHPLARAAVRLCHLTLHVLYVGVLFLGLLVSSPRTLFIAPASGAVMAAVWVVLYRSYEERWPTQRSLINAAAFAAGFLPFVAGVELLGEVGNLVTLAVLASILLVVTHWLATADPPAAATSTPARKDSSTRQLLRVAPLNVVFQKWHATEGLVAGPCHPTHYAAAHFRELLLDEMQRRDPAGFDRWLSEGATQPPEYHVRGDQISGVKTAHRPPSVATAWRGPPQA